MYMILDKRPAMKLPQNHSEKSHDTALAIVLEGVPERWQMNVLQIRGCPTHVNVELDGYGMIDAPAISLTPRQARRLATQITDPRSRVMNSKLR
jgi:hypothetical protein